MNERNPYQADYQLSLGNYHSCALDDNSVVCWTEIDPPTQFSATYDVGQITVPELRNPIAVSAGRGRTCAIDDTGVVCCGYDEPSILDVPDFDNPTEITAGNAHFCVKDDSGYTCLGMLTERTCKSRS